MSRETSDIRSCVFEALDNAEENGYSVASMTLEGIVNDLQSYDAVCELYSDHELRPHVQEWLKEHS